MSKGRPLLPAPRSKEKAVLRQAQDERDWDGERAAPVSRLLPPPQPPANRAATMDYVSTRGSAQSETGPLDFEGVTLAGLAADGGL